MMKLLLAVFGVVFCFSTIGVKAQDCGGYVVLGCFQDYSAAESRSNQTGSTTMVLDTSSARYPNFRAGWFCVADGPFLNSKGREAQETLKFWKNKGIRDAYAKDAC